jgi:hypothetical protein
MTLLVRPFPSACQSCPAVELEPRYVDVAVKRWQALTGEDAELEGHGRTFRVVLGDWPLQV